jgi:hypothetical protein
MLLFFVFSCTTTENIERLSLEGGTWTVESGTHFSIQQEGIGFYFLAQGYLFGHCLTNCIGTISWPKETLGLDAKTALLNISSINRIDAKLRDVNIIVQNVPDISIQSVYGDIWVEAPENAQVSIRSSYGDIDLSVPSGDWKTRLYGKNVINELSENEVEGGGVIDVFSTEGDVLISEIKPVTSY